jgi:hypothetical protein
MLSTQNWNVTFHPLSHLKSETTKDEIKLDKDKGAPSEKGKDAKKDGKEKGLCVLYQNDVVVY